MVIIQLIIHIFDMDILVNYILYSHRYSQCLPGQNPVTGSTGSTASTTRSPNTGLACSEFTKGSFKVGISFDRRNEVHNSFII